MTNPQPLNSTPPLADYHVRVGVVVRRLLVNVAVLALMGGALLLTYWLWWMLCAAVGLMVLVGAWVRLIALVHDLRFLTHPPTVTIYRDGIQVANSSYRWEVVSGFVRPFYTNPLTPLRDAVYLVAAGDMVLLVSDAFENHREMIEQVLGQLGQHFFPRHTAHLQNGQNIHLERLILSIQTLKMGGATFVREDVTAVKVTDTRLTVKGRRVSASIRIEDAQTHLMARYIRQVWAGDSLVV